MSDLATKKRDLYLCEFANMYSLCDESDGIA